MRIALFILLLAPTAPPTASFDLTQSGAIGVEVQVVVTVAPGSTQVTSSKLVPLRDGQLPGTDLFRAERSAWRSSVPSWGFLTAAERGELQARLDAAYDDLAAHLAALLDAFPRRIELTPITSGLTSGVAQVTLDGREQPGVARYSDVGGDFSVVGRTGVFGQTSLPVTSDAWGLQARPALGAGQWSALATLEGPVGTFAVVTVGLAVAGQVRLSPAK